MSGLLFKKKNSSTIETKSAAHVITFPPKAEVPLSLPLLVSVSETPAADLFSEPYKSQSSRNYIFSVDTDTAG